MRVERKTVTACDVSHVIDAALRLGDGWQTSGAPYQDRGATHLDLWRWPDVDHRPEQCRFRLKDEGKPYFRSSCHACRKTIFTGLGKSCSIASPPASTEAPSIAEAARQLRAALDREGRLEVIQAAAVMSGPWDGFLLGLGACETYQPDDGTEEPEL